ncbi:unnamed protein product, partial [Prorocentrum cordatum]
SYNAGISACEKGEEWQHTLALLSEMREAKLQPDAISYSAGVSACAKGEQWQRALALLSEMWDAKVEPNVIQLAAGAGTAERDVGSEAGARRHQLQRWDQRVREGRAVVSGAGATERDVEGEVGARRHLHYHAEIVACARCGQWRQALSLLGEMRNRYVEPNEDSYNLGITAYERSSRHSAGCPDYHQVGLSRFRAS